MPTSAQRHPNPIQRVCFAAAVPIFAGLSVLGFVGTTTNFAQACVQTTTAESSVQSCRPLESRDPARDCPDNGVNGCWTVTFGLQTSGLRR